MTIEYSHTAMVTMVQALSVLKDFSAKVDETISSVQKTAGMTEVIQSDFARLRSETSVAEAESQN